MMKVYFENQFVSFCNNSNLLINLIINNLYKNHFIFTAKLMNNIFFFYKSKNIFNSHVI